ncbi:hypothetical protein S7711_08697 [Stachybotrys chartarum IBT 7711]|uniref:Uncharacterized protein n=1 Tax=Stachybotrys chartarum (strain CBS 109288 / IBT 7711) TaxID=1280523 RepID=A0A084AF93_STACB|nr:hypothetical protein S7711_08697 [Stachybotrys chartarum IBT 7711]
MTDIADKIREASATNKQLLGTLASTDHAAPALEQQRSFLAELKAEHANSTKKLKKLNQSRLKELGEHERYRDSHVKRFMFKATGQGEKYAEKAAKEEREYFEVLHQIQEETSLNNGLEGQIHEAEKVLKGLEQEFAVHQDAQQKLDNLYLSIFSGPTPQFPGEDEKEQRANTALQEYHDTRMKCEAEAYAINLLQSAFALLKQSRDHMEEALMHSRRDMFGGGAMTDMMERNAVSQAERCVKEAQMAVLRASHSTPHVKELPQITFAQGSMFGDVMFDNIFSDFDFHQKLKVSLEDLLKLVQGLNGQLVSAQERQQILGLELQHREQELQTSRSELQKFRERAFEQVASGPPAY